MRRHKVMTGVAVLVIVTFALFLWPKLALFRHPCDQVQTVLSRDSNRRTVVSVFKACTAIGTSVEDSVDLITPKGRRIRLFTFVPWDGQTNYRGGPVTGPFQPSAVWITPTDLRLSIGTVGRITQERTKADGVNVSYDVRTDLSR